VAVDVLDTVARIQGGGQETILVSATCSDPAALQAWAGILLSLRRASLPLNQATQG
jgi:hypothetical protein